MRNRRLILAVMSTLLVSSCDLISSYFPGYAAIPAIGISADKTTIKKGESVTVKANVVHEDLAGVTVQWQVDGVDRAGETGLSFSFSASPESETVYTIRAVAAYRSVTTSADIKITVLPTLYNPLPGRWLMQAGSISLSYWFYEDLTLHRESSLGALDAGFYSHTATTVSFHFVGSSYDETYTYRIAEGVLSFWTAGGQAVGAFQKQEPMSVPANSLPVVTIVGGDRAVPCGTVETITAVVADADAADVIKYEWYVDGTRIAEETATTYGFVRTPTNACQYAVTAVVSDGKNMASAGVVVSVGAPPANPSVIITTACQGYTNVSPIPIVITFSEKVEPPSLTDVDVSGAAVQALTQGDDAFAWNLTIVPAAEGEISVSVPAGAARTVVLGKENLASDVYAVVYDTTAPTISLTTPASGNVIYANTVLSFTGSDLQAPSVSFDNLTWTPARSGITMYGAVAGYDALAGGANVTLYLKDTDRAGNEGYSSNGLIKGGGGAVSVSITLVTPTEADISFGSFDSSLSQSLSESLTVTATLVGAESFAWYLDGTLAGSAASITLSGAALEPGPYTLSLVVTRNGLPYSAELRFHVIN